MGYRLLVANKCVWMVACPPPDAPAGPLLPAGVFNVPTAAAELVAVLRGSPLFTSPEYQGKFDTLRRITEDSAAVQMVLDNLHADARPVVRHALRLNFTWMLQATHSKPSVQLPTHWPTSLRLGDQEEPQAPQRPLSARPHLEGIVTAFSGEKTKPVMVAFLWEPLPSVACCRPCRSGRPSSAVPRAR